VVDTRNYFTHFNPALESKRFRDEELGSACRKLEAIFQLHLLKELGFSEDEIADIVKKNISIKQKLK